MSQNQNAIEIASLLDDSVVGIKHLTSPHGGRVRPASWALIGCGAVLLGLAVTSFGIGLASARANQRSFDAWVAAGHDVGEWRPRALSGGYDALALGGALGGLFCLGLGAARARRERVTPRFRIGRVAGVDAETDALPVDSFDLVAPRGDGFVLHFPSGGEVELGEGARHRVDLGLQRFIVASVPAPRRQDGPVLTAPEGRVVAFAGASVLFHLALIALLRTISPDRAGLDDDIFGDDGRLRRVALAPHEQKTPDATTADGDEGDGPAGASAGAKMALTEGLMGEQHARRPDGRFAIAHRAESPQLARAEAMARARQAGVLGVMRPEMFASLTGTAQFSSGYDTADVLGGLSGYDVNAAYGGWGYGAKDVGPGGGGTSWGTVGISDHGPMGFGASCDAECTGGTFGHGVGHGPTLRSFHATGPKVTMTNSTVLGDLDKNIIRRYIRRKLPEIRFCYEKELQVKHDLSGTVVVDFTISPRGSVQGTAASGMGEKTVEGCVADAISSIQFPAPTGGGLVHVRYPFQFEQAGGQ